MAIQIADGFQLRVAKPLDDRQNVETVAQLDPTYGYEGQIVYVKDIKQFYTCYKDENGSLAYKVMETGSSTPNESAGIELWVSGESYEENDFVSYNDYIYRCKIANNDTDFVEDNWQKQSDTHVEITKQEILDLLDLTDEELETMAHLIDDSAISLNKTYSSSKIYADIRQCLQDSKDFTLGELSKKIGASYKVVSSTSEMTSKDYLYLLSNGSSYDIYIIEEDDSAIKIGNTTIDLSNYYTKSEVDNEFLKQVDAVSTYATISTVEKKIDKDKIVTALDDTVTNDEVASALLIKTELDKTNAKLGDKTDKSYVDASLGEIEKKIGNIDNLKLINLGDNVDANNCRIEDRNINSVYGYCGLFTQNVPKKDYAEIRCYHYGSGIRQFIDYTSKFNTKTYTRFIQYDGNSTTAWQELATMDKLGGLSFSASGTTLTITNGTNTWTLEANS